MSSPPVLPPIPCASIPRFGSTEIHAWINFCGYFGAARNCSFDIRPGLPKRDTVVGWTFIPNRRQSSIGNAWESPQRRRAVR